MESYLFYDLRNDRKSYGPRGAPVFPSFLSLRFLSNDDQTGLGPSVTVVSLVVLRLSQPKTKWEPYSSEVCERKSAFSCSLCRSSCAPRTVKTHLSVVYQTILCVKPVFYRPQKTKDPPVVSIFFSSTLNALLLRLFFRRNRSLDPR